jgi:hypothetical protein
MEIVSERRHGAAARRPGVGPWSIARSITRPKAFGKT